MNVVKKLTNYIFGPGISLGALYAAMKLMDSSTWRATPESLIAVAAFALAILFLEIKLMFWANDL